ncbi:MAG: sigma-54-dependent Fis family transcriptional regulator [Bradymonadales bacterium]|nr:sigma-54-dependent Fis family transcriptional regulator [Bradymonadales bacterium]
MPHLPGVELQQLESSLGSPLRLSLVADLLEQPEYTSTLQELVRQSGRHFQDVSACLNPLIRWGLLEELDGGRVVRLHRDLDGSVLELLQRAVASGAELLHRERHVRHTLLAGMIGVDPKMQLVFEMVRQAARIDVAVMITGETGTGKELVARAVHDLSPRRSGVFGAVNCPTLTESLFESEVFGHARGAFTGAVRDHVGLIERCHRGTFFLDEIGDLSLANQVKLLRVLQEKTFSRVGDGQERSADFRLITATNRDLVRMVEGGEFREELYYRINVFPIRLPSLRERLADLPFLIDEILRNQVKQLRPEGDTAAQEVSTEVTSEALERLRGYNWPGNIRELENVILRAAIMADGKSIRVEHLPPLGLATEPSTPPAGPKPAAIGMPSGSQLKSLAEVERDHILAVLAATRANIRAAAEILGISRTTLYKKIQEHDLTEVLSLRSGKRTVG